MPLAHVQSTGAVGGSAASRSVTFTSTTVSGNLLVVSVVVYSGGGAVGTITVTDNKGNTFTSTINRTFGGAPNDCRIQTFECPNAAGGAGHQITATPSTNHSISLAIHEYSGVATSSPINGTPTSSGTFSAIGASGFTTTTVADTIIFGAWSQYDATVTVTPAAAFTQRYESEDATNMPIATEDRIVSATGAYEATWTLSGNVNWAAEAAAFKIDAGQVTGPRVKPDYSQFPKSKLRYANR